MSNVNFERTGRYRTFRATEIEKGELHVEINYAARGCEFTLKKEEKKQLFKLLLNDPEILDELIGDCPNKITCGQIFEEDARPPGY